MKTIQHGDLKEWKVWVQNLLSLGDLGLLLVGDIWHKFWVIQRKQPCEIPGEGTPTPQILRELREEEMRPEYQLSSQLQLVETNVIVKGEKEFTEKYLVAHRIFRITRLTQQDKLPQILPQNWSSGDATAVTAGYGPAVSIWTTKTIWCLAPMTIFLLLALKFQCTCYHSPPPRCCLYLQY